MTLSSSPRPDRRPTSISNAEELNRAIEGVEQERLRRNAVQSIQQSLHDKYPKEITVGPKDFRVADVGGGRHTTLILRFGEEEVKWGKGSHYLFPKTSATAVFNDNTTNYPGMRELVDMLIQHGKAGLVVEWDFKVSTEGPKVPGSSAAGERVVDASIKKIGLQAGSTTQQVELPEWAARPTSDWSYSASAQEVSAPTIYSRDGDFTPTKIVKVITSSGGDD